MATDRQIHFLRMLLAFTVGSITGILLATFNSSVSVRLEFVFA